MNKDLQLVNIGLITLDEAIALRTLIEEFIKNSKVWPETLEGHISRLYGHINSCINHDGHQK